MTTQNEAEQPGVVAAAAQQNVTRYVAGFMFSPDRQRVALIRKKKPAWQAGLLNGIGGKIEPGESPAQAMAREFHEETGVQVVESFRRFAFLSGPGWSVDFFYTVGDVDALRTMEEEEVTVLRLDEIRVLHDDMVENVPWLIGLAIDQWDDARPRFATIQYP